MLSKQALMRVGAFGEAPPKILRPACLQATHRAVCRPLTSIPTLDVCTRAYDDDFDSYGRGSRSGRSRQGGGDQRRQRGGRSRSFDDEDEWAAATPLDGDTDSRGFSEEITLEGGRATTGATSSGAGAGYENGRQSDGRSYGRGGGGSYERGRGGRGYGRGGGGRGAGERRWGGEQQAGGEGSGGEAAAGGWEGAEGGARPRGEFQGQRGRSGGRGRGGGGGRGSYGRGYGYTAGGVDGGEGVQQRRAYRGPREGLSEEARATRQATNDAVREANDWRALAAVLESRGGSLDAENIAIMMMKVSRREARPTSSSDSAAFESFVASLYGWVSALAGGMRPKQLATCLYAVARLELFNAELVGALAERAKQLMGNFNTWEYSNMAWAFSRMNFTPGEEWLKQFCYWSQKDLPNFKPLELSNTITALARLGHVPETVWLDAFAEAVGKQSADFNMLEIVNTLFSLASLGYSGGPDPQAWMGPLLAAPPAANPGQQQYAWAGGSGMGGGSAGGYGTIESLKLSELTRLTWALTQFNWRPSAGWLRGAVRAFVSQLRYASPTDLSTISYSLAYLRAAPSPDELGLLAGALTRCWGRLGGDELANVAMSLALWQYRCPGGKEAADRWLDEFVLAVRTKLPECSHDGLSKVVSALPLLGAGYRLNMTVNAAQDLLNGLSAPAAEEGQAAEEEAATQDAAVAAA